MNSHNGQVNKGVILLPIARASIGEMFGHEYNATEDAGWLQQQAACFVTLTQQNDLRGCIGTLEAHRPLLEDVKSNAVAAAFHDPRFPPLAEAELNITEIEISLLSPMQKLDFKTQQEALSKIQAGSDGIVFEYKKYRSTFLPQVWEQLPDKNIFISHLKQKAGLTADFWDRQVKIYRYSVSKWRERDLEKAHEAQAL
jgi:AmmeMemoRadiSam system protein A